MDPTWNMITLSTPRLRLREVKESDWPAVLDYQTKESYLQYYPWEERTPANVQRFLQRFIEWRQEQPRSKFQLAITLPETKDLIGLCGIRKKSAQSWEAELGYELDPAYWGQGLATEAARALLSFGFEALRLHRVWASCLAENKASQGVLKKLGMLHEGRLRENRWMKGYWRDTLIYAILRQEWFGSTSES